jgi:hypothetical protein
MAAVVKAKARKRKAWQNEINGIYKTENIFSISSRSRRGGGGGSGDAGARVGRGGAREEADSRAQRASVP